MRVALARRPGVDYEDNLSYLGIRIQYGGAPDSTEGLYGCALQAERQSP